MMMRNEFGGVCIRCGKRVAPRAGRLTPTDELNFSSDWTFAIGRLAVEHDDCALIYEGTDIHHRLNPDPENEKDTGSG